MHPFYMNPPISSSVFSDSVNLQSSISHNESGLDRYTSVSLKSLLNSLVANNGSKQQKIDHLQREIYALELPLPPIDIPDIAVEKLNSVKDSLYESKQESKLLRTMVSKEIDNIDILKKRVIALDSVLKRYDKAWDKLLVSKFFAETNYAKVRSEVFEFKQSMLREKEEFNQACGIKKKQIKKTHQFIDNINKKLKVFSNQVNSNKQKAKEYRSILKEDLFHDSQEIYVHNKIHKQTTSQVAKINEILARKEKPALDLDNIDPVILVDAFNSFQYEEISLCNMFEFLTTQFMELLKEREIQEDTLGTAKSDMKFSTRRSSLHDLRNQIEETEANHFNLEYSKASDELCVKIYLEMINITNNFLGQFESIEKNSSAHIKPPIPILKSGQRLIEITQGFRAKQKTMQRVGKHRTCIVTFANLQKDMSEEVLFDWQEAYSAFLEQFSDSKSADKFFLFVRRFRLVCMFSEMTSFNNYIFSKSTQEDLYRGFGSVIEKANHQYQSQVNEIFSLFLGLVEYLNSQNNKSIDDLASERNSPILPRVSSLSHQQFSLGLAKNKSLTLLDRNNNSRSPILFKKKYRKSGYKNFNNLTTSLKKKDNNNFDLLSDKKMMDEIKDIDKKISGLIMQERLAKKYVSRGFISKNKKGWNRKIKNSFKSKQISELRSLKSC